MMRRVKQRGYLVAIMAICAAILTISYLRLSAGTAASNDKSHREARRVAAYYAAESGLIFAETKMDKFTGKQPNPGVHWFGNLPHSTSRFKVEVRPGGGGQRFIMRAIGTAELEDKSSVSVSIDVKMKQGKDGRWSAVHSRTLTE